MSFATAAILLTAALGSDVLPPAPVVVFTQVDGSGAELGDSFRAQCAGGECRVSFPADFVTRTCNVNAVVKLPLLIRLGSVVMSVGPCGGTSRTLEQTTTRLASFPLDDYGATSLEVMLGCSGERGGSVLNDLAAHPCGNALVRPDIVLWTTARR